MEIEYFEVTRPNVELPVQDIGVTYEVSDRLPLIQQTKKYYIVGVKDFEGRLQPAAFPLMVSRKQGAGWVTNDKFLIFATQAASTLGQLELEQNEILIILKRHPNHYDVELKRFDRSVVLQIPNGMSGITLQKKEVVVAATPSEEIDLRAALMQDPADLPTQNQSTRSGRRISVSQGADGIIIEGPGDEIVNDEADRSQEASASLQPTRGHSLPAQSLKPDEPQVSAVREVMKPAYLRFLQPNLWMLPVLLLVCVLQTLMLFKMRLKQQSPIKQEDPKPAPSPEAQSYSYNISGEAVISQPEAEYTPAEEGDLSGTLDGYSMGQVVQFFNASGDDGILVLTAEKGQEDVMIFNNGQIVAATSGDLTGEEAVYAVLRRQKGSFSFRRTDTSGHERLILQDTMSLLLEGHRLVDEKGFDAA